MVQVKKVENRRELEAFIRLPWRIYREDPAWVPPLIWERKEFLSSRNPFFKYGEACLFLAYQDGVPVGRISAQVNRLHLARYGPEGHFGFLEAIDDQAVFAALLDAAEGFLRARGLKKILGPFNFSINQECGLLVEGFETPPTFLMGHARPYYQAHLAALGYQKAKDLWAYLMTRTEETLARVDRLIPKSSHHVKIRTISKKALGQELALIFSIFNDAWSQNWGFIPFTREDYLYFGKSLKYLVPEDYVRIAEVDGEAAAFIAILPDFNELIKELDGRLFPAGIFKLLWRLKFRPPRRARVVLMGVKRVYQRRLVGPLLILRLIRDAKEALLKRGVEALELSWILEDNRRMCRLAEALGARRYKVYRIYEKEL